MLFLYTISKGARMSEKDFDSSIEEYTHIQTSKFYIKQA